MATFQNTVVNHAVIIGTSTKDITSTAVGSTGQVLTGNTSRFQHGNQFQLDH